MLSISTLTSDRWHIRTDVGAYRHGEVVDLETIIAGASGETPVASLLRQLKVVASRTGTARLAAWVDSELHGYDLETELPSYRGPFDVPLLGHFVGAFGQEARNVPIPTDTFPDELRDSHLLRLSFDHSIAQVQQLGEQDSVDWAWPTNALGMYAALVRAGRIRPVVSPGLSLVAVVRPVASHVFVGICDAVRTHILELALELEQVVPTAGQGLASAPAREDADRVVNNYFFSSMSNVAINSRGVKQSVQTPAPNDPDSLVAYLVAAGVPEDSLDQLRGAIAEDSAVDGPSTRSWPRVRSWFVNASTDLGTNAVGGALATAATAFLT